MKTRIRRIGTSQSFALSMSLLSLLAFSCKKENSSFLPYETSGVQLLVTSDNNLSILDADGRNLKVLANGPAGSSINWQASLSPDGSQVVYASADTATRQILMVDLSTMQTTNLTRDNTFHESPTFAPSGKAVIYLRAQSGFESIYSRNLETGLTIELTPGLNCRTPSFSPDGSRITFWLDNGGDSVGIAMIDYEGHGLTLLGSGTDPRFFPDGRKILFNNFIPPYEEGMYTMDSDGSNRLFLSRIPFQTHGSIAPNGSDIVFSNFVNNNFDIFAIKSDASQVTNLTNTPEAEYEPSFSRDGTRIVYISVDSSSAFRLMTMSIDGRDKRVLLENRGQLRNPSY